MEDLVLNDTDKRLLEAVQGSIALSPDPWSELGERVGISGHEALKRVQRLQELGVIKKIGPIIESKSLGFNASTLVLLKVPREKIEPVAQIVNSYVGITHNYERDCEYNLWFTLRARDDEELKTLVEEIRARIGLADADVADLPTKRRFKIGVRFDIV